MARGGSIKVLFVCTGNVFRSMIAEKVLRNYLKKNRIRGIKVNSAGIRPSNQVICQPVKERLKKDKVKLYKHRHKKITQKLIDKSDVIVSMNLNHKKFIKETFKTNSQLFNKIAYGKNSGVLDFHEKDKKLVNPQDKKFKKELDIYANFIVDHIYAAMPSFVDNLHKYVGKK